MKLIEFDGMEFKLADEALLIRPIRELFLSDKSKTKEAFWRQMSYLWFMCDPRSNYMYITDEKAREEEVKRQEGFEETWQPSSTLLNAMEIYGKMSMTAASLLLKRTMCGVDKIGEFFEKFDVTAVDKNDRPVYQISQLTTALKQIRGIAEDLIEAEKAIAKDLSSNDKVRGGIDKSIGEDI